MGRLEEIQVFLTVLQQGSFSAAARLLEMSPSAVSKLISRLEARLRVQLFERIGSKIRPTQEAETLRLKGLQALSAMQEAEDALTRKKEQLAGLVRIHTALTTAKYLIAPLLPELMARYPALQLEFVLQTVRGDFDKEGIDLAIHSERPKELSLIGRPLMRRPWVIVASPAYLAKHGAPQKPDELLAHRCLNFTIRKQWNSWIFKENTRIKAVDIPTSIGTNQGELLRSFALHGLGIARLAQFHVQADITQGALIPILQDYQVCTDEDRFYLLYPKNNPTPARVQALIDFFYQRLSHFSP